MNTLELPAGATTFVANGGRDVQWPAGSAPVAAGDELRLVDDRGDELGLALADPDNERLRVFATAADGFPKIDGALIGWRVERALALRRQLGLVADGAAFRVVHGAGDGLPGLACDVLGPVAVVYAYGSGLMPIARTLADAVVGFARLRGAVVKLRARGGAADGAAEQVTIGSVDERCVADEAGARYEIHPLGGLNTGLFTDMRVHRAALQRVAAGARVLNLFSYTGALGLACARGGAAEVTNVDTSDGVQAWARGNFERNQVSAHARFEAGDALRFVARAGRDKERYDLVVIDPPTASPARGGKGWIAGRDYGELIAGAAAVIPPGGLLWLAANTHDGSSLAKLAHKALRGRAAAILDSGGLPPEYPTALAQPADRYLQVILLRLA
nr:class I SAM-dependent methyltransferase [Kofleriaceae bacterium]